MKHPRPDDIWVTIPAYNEERMIGRVVAGLRPAGYHVIVVDDGSSDATAESAIRAGATVIRHGINLGQGAALQTAIDFALMHGARYIVTFDADNQHRPKDIAGLIDALVRNGADFALGSRFLGRTRNMPPSRRLLLRAATLFTRITSGLKVTDAHNGLRAMTRRGAAAVHLRQNRMAHASELLDQIAHSRLKYVEVPVVIEYSQYSLQKGQRITDSLAILTDLFARRLHQ